jgi:hypothetical protein
MRARHRGRRRQMRPFRPLGEPRPGKKGMSLGEVPQLSGVLSGDNREPLKRTFWTCVMATKITAPSLI